MSVGVIVVAGGRGERLGAAVPKQLLEIGGRSLLRRSVAAFDAHARVDALVVVLPADLVATGRDLVGATERPCTVVAGGLRRQDSVAAGFGALPPDVTLVLVHDAARPLVDEALITRVIEAAERHGAAVPAVAARDTVKRAAADRFVAETLPRQQIWLAQTPQGFARGILHEAIVKGEQGVEATDEAMLAEAAGHRVAIVAGNEANVKITTEVDLQAARAAEGSAMRVGTGYDLHRLVDRRPLVLAGVVIDPTRGPHGHSDGDVVCHAAVDAMLGAAGAGDIGQHFPNTDPAWKDAAGLDLLRRAVTIAGAAGWRVGNLDVTVVLERPKLAPHTAAVRQGLADALGLPVEAVGVKAKTNEGVDAVGHGEAIAAHAVVLLVPGPRR
ncbi:MAG TPA: 2-C-methyl-D-erythritol 4-phosphate cytidylyltransferase [Vicinamibacterales bacterium]|nr:2-C-methyl-D-erythritol 4-phosphate cytidylyltransferase [Vicinamibacterales bacterium]